MATANSDSESDAELFNTALKKMEEVAKPLKNPNASIAKKREKLEALACEGIIDKTQAFIRKANKKIIEKLYDDYEAQRLGKASDFMTILIISKFASILRGIDAVESADKLSEELLEDKLLRADVTSLTRMISPHIPLIGLISEGCTTAKHVVSHKWSKPKVEHKEVCVKVRESTGF
jgi:hypothetical protein